MMRPCTPCRRRASAGRKTSVNRRLALLRQIRMPRPALPRRGWPRQRRPKGCRRAIRWRGGVAGGPLRANGRLQRAYRHPGATGGEDLSAADPTADAGGRPPPALRVVPGTLWDRLLLSGVRAEIWMQPGVTRAHLDRYAARAYDIRLPRGRASWRWCLAPAMWPRLRHWMCYTSCLLRIRSAC